MSNFRKVPLLGIGVLTPALTGNPQTAEAHHVDSTRAVQMETENEPTASIGAAVELLSRQVFALSLSEKLKIAGDRIRLCEQRNKPATQETKNLQGAQAVRKTNPYVKGHSNTGSTYSQSCDGGRRINNQ
jgi:hypothetical protein